MTPLRRSLTAGVGPACERAAFLAGSIYVASVRQLPADRRYSLVAILLLRNELTVYSVDARDVRIRWRRGPGFRWPFPHFQSTQ